MPNSVVVEDLTVWYKGLREPVLRNISFRVEQGEILLVYGRSGSGKTTLLRVLAGVVGKTVNGEFKGKISIFGYNPYSLSSKDMVKLVAYIPQEPWYAILAPNVWGELTLNQLLVNSYDREKVLRVAEKYSLRNLLYRLTYTLSAGETQRTVIASNILRDTRLFLLDEPTSYLDREHKLRLISYIEELTSRGKTIIVVDHDVDLWSNIADKLLVLDNGVQRYFGLMDKNMVYHVEYPTRGPGIASSDVVLEARGLWYRYPGSKSYVLEGVDLSVGRGEILWVKGPNGSGKTTLLKLLSGVLKPSKGVVSRRGKVIYVSENPLLYFSEPTISEEVGDEELLDLVGLRGLVDRKLVRTSSGERRRAAIASAIARGYDILCLDEPTAGLDPYSKKSVLEAIVRVVEEREVSVIVASHDAVFDRIADKTLELTRRRNG